MHRHDEFEVDMVFNRLCANSKSIIPESADHVDKVVNYYTKRVSDIHESNGSTQ